MQLEFFDVPSPCIGVCQSDDRGFCKGCYRSRDERLEWISLTSDAKQKVVKKCIQRRKRKEAPAKSKVTEQPIQIEQPSLLDPPNKVSVTKPDDMDFGEFEL
jgi:uncharacterized protein